MPVAPIVNILNLTRYQTEDLSDIAAVVWKGWRPSRYLQVSYYTPGATALREFAFRYDGAQICVKFLRNGDRSRGIQALGIVPPRKIDMHPLVRMGHAMVDLPEAPDEVLQQVMWRLYHIKDCHDRTSKPGMQPDFSTVQQLARWAAEHNLRLRFQKEDPSPEEITERKTACVRRAALVALQATRREVEQYLRNQRDIAARAMRDIAEKEETREALFVKEAELAAECEALLTGGHTL